MKKSMIRRMCSVFSAHAEVVPYYSVKIGYRPGILRARGGSSKKDPHQLIQTKYSPRTRR